MEHKRDDGIDLLKGIFVVGMVWGHMMDLWSTTNGIAGNIYYTLSIVTFSGFLFCFGYGMQVSHERGRLTFMQILSNSARILVAFYISGFAYELIVHAKEWTPATLGNVLVLHTLPELSEFLPAFALTSLIGGLLMRPLNWITDSWPRVGVAVILLLLTPFLPNAWVQSPQLCLFVGCELNVSVGFPVLHYFVFFLLGMAVAKHQIGFSWIMTIAGAVGVVAYRYVHYNVMQAQRFPPDTQWLVGGILFLMAWYSGARLLDRVPVVRDILVPIGRNTLFYYLFSNLLLFAGRKSFDNFPIGMPMSLVLTALLLAIIYFFITIIKPGPTKKPSPKAAQS